MIIIDTRGPGEYLSGHVTGAINVPLELFMDDKLPKDLESISHEEKIILYCRSGIRSKLVRQILLKQGYKEVVNGINKDHVRNMLASQ